MLQAYLQMSHPTAKTWAGGGACCMQQCCGSAHCTAGSSRCNTLYCTALTTHLIMTRLMPEPLLRHMCTQPHLQVAYCLCVAATCGIS
jgi:hypothetical protein